MAKRKFKHDAPVGSVVKVRVKGRTVKFKKTKRRGFGSWRIIK